MEHNIVSSLSRHFNDKKILGHCAFVKFVSYFCSRPLGNISHPTSQTVNMNHHSRSGINVGSVVILFFLFIAGFKANAQGGQALFSANCASCHQVNKRLVGPALAGVESRGPWSDRKQVYAWVHNPAGFMKTDPYTAGLFKE